jgi:hypothetical protein
VAAVALRTEIFRALRPEGSLWVVEALPDPHDQTVSRVRTLAAQAGFHEGARYRGWVSYMAKLTKPAG